MNTVYRIRPSALLTNKTAVLINSIIIIRRELTLTKVRVRELGCVGY